MGTKTKITHADKSIFCGCICVRTQFWPWSIKTTHVSGLYTFIPKLLSDCLTLLGNCLNHSWWKDQLLAVVQGVGDICWGCCFQGEPSAKAETPISCDRERRCNCNVDAMFWDDQSRHVGTATVVNTTEIGALGNGIGSRTIAFATIHHRTPGTLTFQSFCDLLERG